MDLNVIKIRPFHLFFIQFPDLWWSLSCVCNVYSSFEFLTQGNIYAHDASSVQTEFLQPFFYYFCLVLNNNFLLFRLLFGHILFCKILLLWLVTELWWNEKWHLVLTTFWVTNAQCAHSLFPVWGYEVVSTYFPRLGEKHKKRMMAIIFLRPSWRYCTFMCRGKSLCPGLQQMIIES